MGEDVRDQIKQDAVEILARWTPAVRFADTYWCYRLLLQRPPEFNDSPSYKARSSSDLRTLVKEVLQSHEFSQLWNLDLHMQPLPPVTVLGEYEGLRYWFNLRDRIIGLTIAQGRYEPDVTRLVRKLVKPGMNCLDLGANIGYFSVLLGSIVGPHGRVYSFEPFPANYELLSRNIRENGLEAVVEMHQVAAVDRNKDCALYFRPDDLNDNYGSMFVAEDFHTMSQLESITCRGRRAQDLVPSELPIHFVKIDIEGGEVRGLQGIARILERDHPIMVIELNEQGLLHSGNTPEDLVAALRSYKYKIVDITSGHPLNLSANRREPIFTNLLCT